jgi:hypothetical protein
MLIVAITKKMLPIAIPQGGKSGNESMLFICDNDGYAKAQSRPMPMEQGEEAFKRMLADGMQEFTGDIKTVS